MKKYIAVISIALLFGCADKVENLVPNTAISDAQIDYKKQGYTPITITSNGQQYHGKRNYPQEVIFCVFSGDLKLRVVKVHSIQEQSAKQYVDLYNDEMMKQEGIKRGCFK